MKWKCSAPQVAISMARLNAEDNDLAMYSIYYVYEKAYQDHVVNSLDTQNLEIRKL